MAASVGPNASSCASVSASTICVPLSKSRGAATAASAAAWTSIAELLTITDARMVRLASLKKSSTGSFPLMLLLASSAAPDPDVARGERGADGRRWRC